jgi:GNAT superfamily N-acetyltransferase
VTDDGDHHDAVTRQDDASSVPRVRPVDAAEHELIRLVAERMHETLVEVLGPERGGAMYTPDWLVDRVRFHLDPTRCDGAVLVAGMDGGIAGHTIVRREPDDDGTDIGLFSTMYVAPTARRHGIAQALLDQGERWMRDRDLPRAVTYTEPGNHRLVALFTRRGYTCTPVDDDFVRLARALG